MFWIQLYMNGNVIWIANHVTSQLLKHWTFTVWNIAQRRMQQITWYKNNHLQTKLHVIGICDINDIFYVPCTFWYPFDYLKIVSKLDYSTIYFRITMKKFTQYNTSLIIILGSTLPVDLAYNCMALMSHQLYSSKKDSWSVPWNLENEI